MDDWCQAAHVYPGLLSFSAAFLGVIWGIEVRLTDIAADFQSRHCYPFAHLTPQEMFRQGDREKTLGQPVSPLMDRARGGVTKSQTGFFNIVARPIFTVSGLPPTFSH